MAGSWTTGIVTGLRRPRRWRRSIALIVVALLVAVAVSLMLRYAPAMRVLVRDVIPVAGGMGGQPPLYTGWLVYVGVFGWYASSAFGLLAGLVAARAGARRPAALLLAFGAISAILGSDDLFLFHDGYLARITHLSETQIQLAWVVLAVAWGLVFLPEITADPDLPVFTAAVVLFGYSVLSDLIESPALKAVLHEEAAKLGSIVLWTAWALLLALRHLDLATRPAVAGPASRSTITE